LGKLREFANRLRGGARGAVCENVSERPRQVIENKRPERRPPQPWEGKFRKPPRCRAKLAACEKPAPCAVLTGPGTTSSFNNLQKCAAKRVSQTFFVFISPKPGRRPALWRSTDSAA
jgi:hypothetical protein